MYKVRDKVYASAGYSLHGKNKKGYKFKGELSDFTEKKVVIDDMAINGNLLIYSNGDIVEYYDKNAKYEDLKAKIVKRVFSNDDQIAIILNKDSSPENAELYNKMQEWREWAGILANKIASLST